MPTVKQVKEDLDRWYNDDDVICNIIWQADDVKMQAENFDPPLELTDDEVNEILNLMDRNHDANYGIGWDTIDVYLIELRNERLRNEKAKQEV